MDNIDPDLHAHSPERYRPMPSIDRAALNGSMTYGLEPSRFMPHPPILPTPYPLHDPYWGLPAGRRLNNRTDKSDISMPDYSPPARSENSSRNGLPPGKPRGMSDTFSGLDAALSNMTRILDSANSRYVGSAALSNTRASSMAETPCPQPILATQTPQASIKSLPIYQKYDPLPRDVPSSCSRSDVMMTTRSFDDENPKLRETTGHSQPPTIASTEIRSKKEGNAYGSELVGSRRGDRLSAGSIHTDQGSVKNSITYSNSRKSSKNTKRKRGDTSVDLAKIASLDALPLSSPRKTSKTDISSGPGSKSEGGTAQDKEGNSIHRRSPLSNLDNTTV